MTKLNHETRQAVLLVDVQPHFIDAFNELARLANQNARVKGFWDDYDQISDLLDPKVKSHHTWLRSTSIQAAIARIHSELSEALEAIRTGNPSDTHLVQYTGLEAEFADVIIRILDMAGEFNLRVSEAVIDKMLYNSRRPYKHSKNS